jgi:GAF domain-containing protein
LSPGAPPGAVAETALLDQLASNEQVTPESLVPRLGDYLIEIGVILPEDLERALEYQRNQTSEGKTILIGQALLELKLIDREILDQVTTKQLLSLQSALRDTNRQLEQRVRQRTLDLERRLLQIRTAAEVTQIAISASGLDELLKRTVDLIAERFNLVMASIFLTDEVGEYAILADASGKTGQYLKESGVKIRLGTPSIIAWAIQNNRSRIANDVAIEADYLKEESLADTKSEACIPIALGNRVLGALDLQHAAVNAFDPDATAVLQTVANHIAATVQNFRLFDATQANLKLTSSLYQASHQISQAETTQQILSSAIETLNQSPYLSIVLHGSLQRWQVISAFDADAPGSTVPIEKIAALTFSPSEVVAEFQTTTPILITQNSQASAIFGPVFAELQRLGCKAAAFIPVTVNNKLEALFILGARRAGLLNQATLQPYASLAQLSATALEKINALQRLEKRLAALQALSAVSEAISVETDLNMLYRAIHHEVARLMEAVNFAIALYNPASQMIHIPYLHETGNDEVQIVDPFPLGQGLTSIIIRTRQPLMIVDNVEERLRNLNTIQVGRQARSWLGVPLLVGGEVIGAIIVQDLEQEGRFDEDDQRLLSTLASQVAVAVRNARLLDQSFRLAERERLLYDITSKIRGSVDRHTILATTTRELSKALGVRRAHIEVGVISPTQEAPQNGGKPAEIDLPVPIETLATGDDQPASKSEPQTGGRDEASQPEAETTGEDQAEAV